MLTNGKVESLQDLTKGWKIIQYNFFALSVKETAAIKTILYLSKMLVDGANI